MKVTLMTWSRLSVTPLPVVGDDITWGREMNGQSLETINAGEIYIPGEKKLREISISSFLPKNEGNRKTYKYSKTYLNGELIVKRLERWRDSRTPVRLVIATDKGTPLLNMLVIIESFYRGLDRVSDIPYTLKLKEYIELK